jgi:hypothetical protein
MLELLRVLWVGWNERVLRNLLRFQNAILMGVVWVFALAPLAILLRLMRHPLIDRSPPDTATKSYWQPRDGKPMTMDQASRQF